MRPRSRQRCQPWLSRERSTLAFLAGAALVPAIPALLGRRVLPRVGITVGPAVPAALDSWLRGTAGILALSPVVFVYCSGPLREWVGLPSHQHGLRQHSSIADQPFSATVVNTIMH